MRMRNYFLLLATVSLLALVAVTARGDVIILNTGGRVEGKIIEEDVDKVLVKTPYGMTRIPFEDIENIERKPTVWEIYSEKSTKIDDFDVEGHWKIAQWCKDQRGLEQEYKTELELILSLKPDHKEAGEAYTELKKKEDELLAKLAKKEAERRKKESPTPGEKTATDSSKPPEPTTRKHIVDSRRMRTRMPEHAARCVAC